MLPEPRKFAVIQTICKEAWDGMSLKEKHELMRKTVTDAAHNNPSVAGVLDDTFAWWFEADIPFVSPPLSVVVRATVMAIPAQEVSVDG